MRSRQRWFLALALMTGLIGMIALTVAYQINSPEFLLRVIRKNDAELMELPYGQFHRSPVELRQLALARLIGLQKARFGSVNMASVADRCVGVDSIGVSIVGRNQSGNIILSGTPSLHSDHKDQGAPYDVFLWNLELFEFTPEGRLINRQCYTSEGEKS